MTIWFAYAVWMLSTLGDAIYFNAFTVSLSWK